MGKQYKIDEVQLQRILEEIVQMLIKKNQEYGGASFDLGLNGNMVHLWDKIKRYRTLVEKKLHDGSDPTFENIQDTLKDIIGYGLIGLVILEKDGFVH